MCAIDNWMTSDLRPEELEYPGPLFSLAGATDMGSATGWQSLVEGRCFTIWTARPQHNPACG